MGTLYLISTPIGNLEDISLRAIRLLGEVSLVAAEDTRTARKLLTRHGIRQRLLSYNEHNMRTRTQQILAALEEADVALVTEAGTPAISDPGYELVLATIAAGFQVSPVPGPSAVVAALAVSGLPAREFTFLGFPPRRSRERRDIFASLARETRTLIFFESPHRLLETFEDMQAVWGDRRIAVCRELTKAFEEVFRGSLSEAKSHFREPRGEFTLVLEGASPEEAEATDEDVLDNLRWRLSEGLSLRDAVTRVSQEMNVARRRVYELGLELQGKRSRGKTTASDAQCL